MRKKRRLCAILAATLCLAGCGGPAERPGDAPPSSYETDQQQSVPTASYAAGQKGREEKEEKKQNFVPYQAPEFAGASFHADKAEGNDRAKIDLSETAKGYVAVSATSDRRLKFQVIKGEDIYSYDMASDGTVSIFPIQLGDGEYTFRVMENVTEGKYAKLCVVDKTVKLEDEFQPFLRPSDYVNYTKESECVKTAAQLAAGAEDAPGVVAAVFDYICGNVKYDNKKAKSVQDGVLTTYLPTPDETLRTGQGICFDYAALAAAMLRSQGIPTKMVFGYVSPDGIYHAWNMFYTDETGWVTVKYQVKEDSWNRLDLTFSAGGADDSFVGDGKNYADVYYY